MIWNGSYVGNAKAISQLTMSPFEIIAFLFINIAGYIVLYFLYISTRNKKPIFKFIPSQFAFNKQRFHIFIFILIISNLLFTLYTGVGIINSKATSEYSFIFAYFKVESIFLLKKFISLIFYYMLFINCIQVGPDFFFIMQFLSYIFILNIKKNGIK
jgi:hypothetical protein